MNPKYSNHWPLFTTQDEWTIVKYIMYHLRLFRYCTLWLLKRHTVTQRHGINLYNDIFDYFNGVMPALAQKKTQGMDDLYFTMKFA